MDVPHRLPQDHRRRSTRDRTRREVAALVVTAALAAVPAAGRAATPAIAGPPVTATWRAVPLREWAGRMATILGRPVIVDRRLDPDTAVTRDCREEPFDDVLTAVVGGAGGAIENLPSWIRIVPTAAAGRAAGGDRERRAEIARLPAAARTTLAERCPWSWVDGARPRDLVAAAAADAGLDVAALDAVPHDHLPAGALPPLTLAERLDLVLAHYDLRVSWMAGDDTSPRGSIVPLPAGDAAGPAVVPAVRPKPGKAPRPGKGPQPGVGERFTLRLEAPLDEALAAIGPRLGLEPEIDRESLAARGVLPGEIVRAAVTDATRDQLLDALVAPLGLRWRIDGVRLVVDAPAR